MWAVSTVAFIQCSSENDSLGDGFSMNSHNLLCKTEVSSCSKNKIHIYNKIRKKLNIKWSALTSPLCTAHYVSALGINWSSPISRNTCSAINSNILPVPIDNSSRDDIPSWSCKGSHEPLRWHFSLELANCQ